MRVEYFHEIPGVGYGNIMWRGAFPMRGGIFPANHPAAPGPRGDIFSEFGAGERMAAFRARGYYASCFPEGDGITMRCLDNQHSSRVAEDIASVFGWAVDVKRASPETEPHGTEGVGA